MKLNGTQRLVLLQAIADGGTVELSGLDMHPGWSKRHITAARQLHHKEMGFYHPAGGYEAAKFQILPAGRSAVKPGAPT